MSSLPTSWPRGHPHMGGKVSEAIPRVSGRTRKGGLTTHSVRHAGQDSVL